MAVIEILIEIFGESMISLSSALVPEKPVSEKTKKIIAVICAVFGLISMICLIIGIALLSEESGKFITAGIVFISIFGIYLIIVITANIIRLIRKRIKSK